MGNWPSGYGPLSIICALVSVSENICCLASPGNNTLQIIEEKLCYCMWLSSP